MTTPRAITALEASLRRAREPALRGRIEAAINYLRVLYGVPHSSARRRGRDLDLKRRKVRR
jgi:hypothetical protein